MCIEILIDMNKIYHFFFVISGEVELENLPLRRDALRHLGLPLEAVSGTIGKIKLQVPVRQFRSAPWCILIERVYVVVGPINLNEVRRDFLSVIIKNVTSINLCSYIVGCRSRRKS